jgi:hypothetical protein
MKIVNKLAIILLIACLVMMGVSCGDEEEANELKVGIIGPMQFHAVPDGRTPLDGGHPGRG